MHLLSTVEHDLYYTLRFSDSVLDIREQYPLDMDETQRLCRKFGIRHPSHMGEDVRMTTDQLVTVANTGLSYIAFSVKPDMNLTEREQEKLFIEKQYWLLKKVPYFLVTRDMLNPTYADNVRLVTEYYDLSDVYGDMDFLKSVNSTVLLDEKNYAIFMHDLIAYYPNDMEIRLHDTVSAIKSRIMELGVYPVLRQNHGREIGLSVKAFAYLWATIIGKRIHESIIKVTYAASERLVHNPEIHYLELNDYYMQLCFPLLFSLFGSAGKFYNLCVNKNKTNDNMPTIPGSEYEDNPSLIELRNMVRAVKAGTFKGNPIHSQE